MFGKSHTFALAVATAGLIGMSATMASASTPGGGDFGGLLNVSHNQIPLQLCNDTVPVNVIGGQLPIEGLAPALGLASAGSTVAKTNSSCHQGAREADDNNRDERCMTCFTETGEVGHDDLAEHHEKSGDDVGGLANASDNEIPLQICSVTVPVNGIGVQIPLQNTAAGLGVLSTGNTRASQDSSCHSNTSQSNGNG